MSERSAVQNPMIKYAQQIGWAYVRLADRNERDFVAMLDRE